MEYCSFSNFSSSEWMQYAAGLLKAENAACSPAGESRSQIVNAESWSDYGLKVGDSACRCGSFTSFAFTFNDAGLPSRKNRETELCISDGESWKPLSRVCPPRICYPQLRSAEVFSTTISALKLITDFAAQTDLCPSAHQGTICSVQ